jgi:cell division protein FtsB
MFLVTIAFLVLTVRWGLNAWNAHDQKVYDASHAAAVAANQQNAVVQAQTQQQVAALAAENLQLKAMITQLTLALTARQKVEQKIPQVVQALPISEVARQLGGTTDALNNVVLPLPAAQHVLEMVQLVPLLQQDKADLVRINQNLSDENTNLVTANGALTTALTSEKDAHAKDNKVNTDQVNLLKAKNWKSKFKWFGIGFVTGYVTATAQRLAGF